MFRSCKRSNASPPRISPLNQIESLTAANLANDDPVWPVPECCFQKITDRDGRQTVLLTPGLESKDILFLNLYLRSVLDQDNALVVWNALRQNIGASRLAT